MAAAPADPDGTDVPPTPLDDTDRLILRALVRDGRASHRELAERTGVSLATVNRRIRQMELDGTIRGYTAVVAPERVGWGLTTIVGLRIDKGQLRAVLRTLAMDPRVFGVYDVTGEWDAIVLARVRDRADLDNLAKGPLSNPHIQRTNTMVVLDTVMETAAVRLPSD